jgi:RNA polymerase sigma factor (sigma-70 family)
VVPDEGLGDVTGAAAAGGHDGEHDADAVKGSTRTMTQPGPLGSGRAHEARTEDDLLDAVRAGDTGAYAELYHRHHHEALRLARNLRGPHDPDDVAQEAFVKILRSILRGAGPQRGFAPYLMRVVRNEVIDRTRRAHEDAVEDLERAAPGRFIAPDGVDELFDRQLVRTAFERLPEAWQRILWLTEVEGETPRTLAPQLGRSPNAVAQLSRRAREGLRAAWLQAHIDTSGASPLCRGIAKDLDAHEHGRLSPARSAAVQSHLEECPSCTAARDEMRGLAVQMRSLLLPVVLGSPLLLERLSEVVAAVGPAADGAPAPDAGLRTLSTGGGSWTLRGALATHAGAVATLGALAAVVVGGAVLVWPSQERAPLSGIASTGTGGEADQAATGDDGEEGSAASTSPASPVSATPPGSSAIAGDDTPAPVQVPTVHADPVSSTSEPEAAPGEEAEESSILPGAPASGSAEDTPSATPEERGPSPEPERTQGPAAPSPSPGGATKDEDPRPTPTHGPAHSPSPPAPLPGAPRPERPTETAPPTEEPTPGGSGIVTEGVTPGGADPDGGTGSGGTEADAAPGSTTPSPAPSPTPTKPTRPKDGPLVPLLPPAGHGEDRTARDI